MKQALLVIDVQNDYFKNGKMELVGPDQALDKIKQLEQYFNEKDLPIIYVQHINPPQASFFQENTEGVLLHPELSAGSNSLIVTKHYPNSFLETNLKELLKVQSSSLDISVPITVNPLSIKILATRLPTTPQTPITPKTLESKFKEDKSSSDKLDSSKLFILFTTLF